MRWSSSVVPVGGVWIALIMLVAIAISAGNVAPPAVLALQATATPDDRPTPEISVLELIELPAADETSEGYLFYRTLIEFPPQSSTGAMDTHLGQFVLTVTAGSVCYEVGLLVPGTTVTAIRSAAVAPAPGCGETSDLDCENRDDVGLPPICTLSRGDVIFLPAGSSLTQVGDGDHFYENVTDEPATVYLTGYELDEIGAACRGSCY